MSARMLRATVGAVSAGSNSIENRFATAKARRLLAAAAVVVVLAPAGAANAVTVPVLKESYSLTYTPAKNGSHTQTGKPTFSYSLSQSTYTLPGSVLDGVGGTKSASGNYDTLAFFTINPSSSCGSYCFTNTEGTGRNQKTQYTQQGIITASVTFTLIDGLNTYTGTLVESGLYQAKYGGAALACAGKSAGTTGPSDCIDWSKTSGAKTALASSDLAQQTASFTVDLGPYSLLVSFNNAEDWSIKPTINFKLVADPVVTPIPGALPLFVSGMGMFGYVGWRRKKRAEKASGVAA